MTAQVKKYYVHMYSDGTYCGSMTHTSKTDAEADKYWWEQKPSCKAVVDQYRWMPIPQRRTDKDN